MDQEYVPKCSTRIMTDQLKAEAQVHTCSENHKFLRLRDHPIDKDSKPRCPYCMAEALDFVSAKLYYGVDFNDSSISEDEAAARRVGAGSSDFLLRRESKSLAPE